MQAPRKTAAIMRGVALAAAVLAVLAPGASAAPGEPDPSFGTGGIAEPLPPNSGSSLSALGFAPGGAIDAIGTYSPSDEYEVLALRLTESGVLDPDLWPRRLGDGLFRRTRRTLAGTRVGQRGGGANGRQHRRGQQPCDRETAAHGSD